MRPCWPRHLPSHPLAPLCCGQRQSFPRRTLRQHHPVIHLPLDGCLPISRFLRGSRWPSSCPRPSVTRRVEVESTGLQGPGHAAGRQDAIASVPTQPGFNSAISVVPYSQMRKPRPGGASGPRSQSRERRIRGVACTGGPGPPGAPAPLLTRSWPYPVQQKQRPTPGPGATPLGIDY